MTKTRSIIRNVIYRYYRAVSFSDNNMELLRGEASKLHLSFLKLKICIVFNRFCYLNGFINIYCTLKVLILFHKTLLFSLPAQWSVKVFLFLLLEMIVNNFRNLNLTYMNHPVFHKGCPFSFSFYCRFNN